MYLQHLPPAPRATRPTPKCRAPCPTPPGRRRLDLLISAGKGGSQSSGYLLSGFRTRSWNRNLEPGEPPRNLVVEPEQAVTTGNLGGSWNLDGTYIDGTCGVFLSRQSFIRRTLVSCWCGKSLLHMLIDCRLAKAQPGDVLIKAVADPCDVN